MINIIRLHIIIENENDRQTFIDELCIDIEENKKKTKYLKNMFEIARKINITNKEAMYELKKNIENIKSNSTVVSFVYENEEDDLELKELIVTNLMYRSSTVVFSEMLKEFIECENLQKLLCRWNSFCDSINNIFQTCNSQPEL